MKHAAGESCGLAVAGASIAAALAISGCTANSTSAVEISGGIPWSALDGATAAPTAGTDPCAVWNKDGAAAVKNRLTGELEKIVTSQIIGAHVSPGAAVVVGCGDKAIVLLGRGNRSYDDATAKKVSVDTTLYDLASVQKPIIGATALTLEKRGKMNLTAPVSTYLPGYTGDSKSKVTIEQLLMHRAGMNPPGKDDLPYKSIIGSATTPGAVQKNILSQAPRVEPGGSYSYSNVGYSIAGMAISSAAGQPLDGAVRTAVLEPLGMTKTQFNPNPSENTCAPTSSDYNLADTFTCKPQDWLSRAEGGVAGHAGLFATAEDMAKFAAMLANQGSLNGKQVLTPDQVARMAKSQPNASYGLAARTNSAGRYGPFMGPQAFGHTGWNGTSFVVDPVSRMWIVGLANVSLGQKVEGETKPLNNFLGAFAAMGEAVANNYSALANQ